jgi:hypothetical protein
VNGRTFENHQYSIQKIAHDIGPLQGGLEECIEQDGCHWSQLGGVIDQKSI